MSILRDVLAELVSMFVADLRLTLAILSVVAVAAGLVDLGHVAPLVGGSVLLIGCLSVLILTVVTAARRKR